MAKASKLSKLAASRLAVSATVTSSAVVHGPQVVAPLHAVLFPTGPAKPELTEKFLAALGDVLERAAKEVQDADLAHAAELLDDVEPRQLRDDAHAKLVATLLSLRETLAALYGPSTMAAYGLGEPLPELSTQLLQRGRAVESLLRKTAISARPLRAGVTLKASALSDELAPIVEALGKALDAVARESREAQLTLERKNQATEAWGQVYQGVTSAFYGLYLLAGRKDLADRIEPTARRRAGLAEEDDVLKPLADDGPAAPGSAGDGGGAGGAGGVSGPAVQP